MVKSERDRLKQLIKETINEYLFELIEYGLSLETNSIVKATNKAYQKVDDCTEAIVRQWERENKR